MPDMKSLNEIYLVLILLVPGLVVIYVRSQFVTGRRPPHSEAILSYLTVSCIYYALALPFVDLVISLPENSSFKIIAWFTMVFLGPAFLGLALGVNIQKGLFHRFLKRCNLNPVHVMPTAWDWKLGGMTEEWVLVTLKDGTRFGGFCGKESFMSSDPAERDLYIQWIYDIDDNNKWAPRGENGVLITAGEISTIEFWPYKPKEMGNEQK
ncbi:MULTISPECIES: DUF6338 family protein [unclassified Nitrospina]|uniref:DUF6338 family protein n=1 Tax=unclassified Nitrospina TaxID=2638683 RepID=UPI003F9C3F6F